jgi:hypothetical protein
MARERSRTRRCKPFEYWADETYARCISCVCLLHRPLVAAAASELGRRVVLIASPIDSRFLSRSMDELPAVGGREVVGPD